MAARAAADVHPPLYFLALRAATRLAGTTEPGLRSLSVAFGIAALIILWLAARRLFSRPAAFWATAALALSPFIIYQFVNARMYAMLAFLETALLATGAMYLERPSARSAAAFIAASILSVYTHYLALVLIGCFSLAGCVVLSNDRGRLWRWIALGAVPGLAFLPWLGVFIGQFGQARALTRFQPGHLLTIGRLISPAAVAPEPLSGLFAAAAILLAASGVWSALKHRESKAAVWLALCLVGLLAFFIAASFVAPIANRRYLIVFAPLAAIFFGRTTASLRGPARSAVLAAMVAALALSAPYISRADRNSDWPAVANYLRQEVKDGDLVLMGPNFNSGSAHTLNYYINQTGGSGALAFGRNVFATGRDTISGIRFNGGGPAARWFIIEDTEKPCPQALRTFQDHGYERQNTFRAYHLNVYLFSRRPA